MFDRVSDVALGAGYFQNVWIIFIKIIDQKGIVINFAKLQFENMFLKLFLASCNLYDVDLKERIKVECLNMLHLLEKHSKNLKHFQNWFGRQYIQ